VSLTYANQSTEKQDLAMSEGLTVIQPDWNDQWASCSVFIYGLVPTCCLGESQIC